MSFTLKNLKVKNLHAWLAMIVVAWLVEPTTARADQPSFGGAAAADVLLVENLIVASIDSVAVASKISGTLGNVLVVEGATVTRNQLLGQLDDEEAKAAYLQAIAEAKIAAELAGSTVAGELAEQELVLAQQAMQRHALSVEIAERKADSDFRLQAAEQAALAAKVELDRATAAHSRFPDSVSQSEIDGLALAYRRLQFESQQAALDRQLDSLAARVEQAAALQLETAKNAAQWNVAKSRLDQKILRLRADLIGHHVEQAKHLVWKHRILSPLDGVVAEVFRRPGEWVQPGDAILRIVRLNRLRAEGFLSAQQASVLRAMAAQGGPPATATLSWTNSAGEPTILPATVSFVSPEVDVINGQVRFWVEFENPHQQVYPGMKVAGRIDLITAHATP